MKLNRANETLLSAEYVRTVLKYDWETGKFTWRSLTHKKSNRLVGQEAGSTHNKGYRMIIIHKRRYYAHRLAWLYMTGNWPEYAVDHADRCTSNNAWCNLREATIAQNGQNIRTPKNNTSGHIGVRRRPNGRYQVRLNLAGKTYVGGSFADLESAVAARDKLKVEAHTFHPRCA